MSHTKDCARPCINMGWVACIDCVRPCINMGWVACIDCARPCINMGWVAGYMIVLITQSA